MAGVHYRFGPFLVDRAAYRVSRGPEAVELTPKLLDLLLYFLERPPRSSPKLAMSQA